MSLRGVAASLTERLVIAPEVADALSDGRPVVALESTLISHGLPYPQNLEVATASEAAVGETPDAVPATVAVRDGRLLVGLDEAALEALATAPRGSVRKAARPSLAIALAEGGWAATTVSATMIVASAAGITTFATGGIGGVHRGALDATGGTPASLDISSDLEELGRTAMAVVCAGPKAILDVPATLEYLETRGVPVISIGQDEVPGFFARSSGIKAPAVARDEDHAARIVAAHLALGLGSGALVCVPVPPDVALRDDVARDAVQHAIADAEDAGIAGPAVTPWLLARIAEITNGRSVPANTALIVNNARFAGRLAAALRAASSSVKERQAQRC
jgi:pseudouridylate synthase